VAQRRTRGVGENHTDGFLRGSTVEFGVNKITQSPESIPQGNNGDEKIRDFPETQPGFSAVPESGQNDTDESAMITHAGNTHEPNTVRKIKRQQDFQGVRQVVGQIVKYDVPESGTENQTDDHGSYEIVELLSGEMEAVFRAKAIPGQEIDDGKCHHIHHAVITQ